jgi:hypothetical protein
MIMVVMVTGILNPNSWLVIYTMPYVPCISYRLKKWMWRLCDMIDVVRFLGPLVVASSE